MKHLIITLLILVLSSTAGARSIYLVSAGISDYPGTINNLRLPDKDAKSMYYLYTKYASAKSVLLTNEHATKESILDKMRGLFSLANKDDIVVFFFSGHGYQGGFVAYDDYLPYSDIKSIFADCKSVNKMILADACFSGGLRDRNILKNECASGTVLTFLSSRGEEYSIESAGMKNGFFTAALIGGLKGGADSNKDRIITAKELFKAVSKKVRELSGDAQHPVMWGKFPDTMPVMAWRKTPDSGPSQNSNRQNNNHHKSNHP